MLYRLVRMNIAGGPPSTWQPVPRLNDGYDMRTAIIILQRLQAEEAQRVGRGGRGNVFSVVDERGEHVNTHDPVDEYEEGEGRWIQR